MIRRFGKETALLAIDVQTGVDELSHWGGVNGRRNNPHAEQNIALLLSAWRAHGLPVIYTRHDSREVASPLRSDKPGFAFKPGLEPHDGEAIIEKDVNSSYIGTELELTLRRLGASRIVHVGFFTNMCVETTVRMSGNLGYDSYLVDEACFCSNRVSPAGVDYDPDVIHDTTVATLHGEFCTNLKTDDALKLVAYDANHLERVQGNE